MSYVSSSKMNAIATTVKGELDKKTPLTTVAPAYDSATVYKSGVLLTYNQKLYECIKDATAGTLPTDTTYFKEVTVKEELDGKITFGSNWYDGSGGVAYADYADNLTPYDESSGDDQDEPFLFQATGTANGTQPDFATGSFCQLKEKRGNSLVWRQRVVNPTFTNGTTDSWFLSNMQSDGVVDGYLKLVIGNSSGTSEISQNTGVIAGHKYLYVYDVYCVHGTGEEFIYPRDNNGNVLNKVIPTTKGTLTTFIYTATSGQSWISERFFVWGTGYEIYVKSIVRIELTRLFGEGNEPTSVDDPRAQWAIAYAQRHPEYNAGAIINSDGRYLKNIGMNQWDEEWEVGTLNTDTGVNQRSTSRIRSKNYIRVIPGATYYYKQGNGSSNGRWCFYDENKNFVSAASINPNSTFVVPQNAHYLRFSPYEDYGTTYRNDISINLYYEDEARCLTYEPYGVVANVDTGSEVLYSAGTAHDVKTPDGTITRNVDMVDLGTLNWVKSGSDDSAFFYVNLTGYYAVKFNDVLCAKYSTSTSPADTGSTSTVNKVIGFTADGASQLRVRDTSYANAVQFKGAMSGVYAYLPLLTPTTEQGTPFPENVPIDDFGTMQWLKDGENNAIVPAEVLQGNLIFYPVDYKAFDDTMYKYTDGTPSNLAKKTVITDAALEARGYYKMHVLLTTFGANGMVGGTLRQLLANKRTLEFANTACVDLGNLSWSYSDGWKGFIATISDYTAEYPSGTQKPFILCTKYKEDNYQGGNNSVMSWTGLGEHTILVKDPTYGQDATAFANGSKGVLLAYKKTTA